MINRRMIRNAMFVLFAASVTFAACGGEATPTATEKYCNLRCACEKCSSAELASCNDDFNNMEDEARSAKCGSPFNTYLTCLTNDAECTDGAYDDSFCFNEETDVKNCINPPPACASTNDGICDEPAPLGTGKCPSGSDSADCGTCATTNDGLCDEPEGTGTCPEGTDTVDCGELTCATTNNEICDEPQGTGTCAPGTDTADCNSGTCPTTSNAICDEPEGTGLCPEGSDFLDCACVYKENGTCDEPEGTGLCLEGTDIVDCEGVTCATTDDGNCDEPQGTGNCPAGSDTADCSLPCVTCGEYITTGMLGGGFCTDSETLYQNFVTCMCDGPCMSACGTTFCMGNDPSSTCQTCAVSGACSAQFAACANDV